MRRPTVLPADDYRETAEQLRELLRPHFDVVGLVEDGRALVSAATPFTLVNVGIAWQYQWGAGL